MDTGMQEELARLRKALAEANRERDEANRERDEADRERDEADRRRDKAETLILPLTAHDYLDVCHSLNLAIDVVTDSRKTTKGVVTDPTNRIYPRRIVPWTEFPLLQEKIWSLLDDKSFVSNRFPSRHQMEYVRSLQGPISCEQDLRYFERDTVENAVQKLVAAVLNKPKLCERLGLRGAVTFESHTNLGSPPSNTPDPDDGNGNDGTAPPPAKKPRRVRPTARGSADQFCIYRTSDGANIPAAAIEYKAPHKLGQDEVITGLEAEIRPGHDIINKDGEGTVFMAKSLAAAVITQLFSYMISKGIQYGYVCTGQAFVFLFIPQDSTMVMYHLCIPSLDMAEDIDNMHRTAVGQVFAFILQAIRASPPDLAWYDTAATLDRWEVEYDDVLRSFPESVRKDKAKHTPYKPQKWKPFDRSPIRTRAHCKAVSHRRGNDDDDQGGNSGGGGGDSSNSSSSQGAPNTPTPVRPTQSRNANSSASGSSGAGGGGCGDNSNSSKSDAGPSNKKQQESNAAQVSIRERQYCTHACLLGLTQGGPVDAMCPNATDHGPKHINNDQFLHLLRAQLAVDRGPNADSMPLYITGSVGSMFKLRLSAYGYTLVAKGVRTENLPFLQDEKHIYDELRAIQGRHIPVCAGLINLVLPHYCDGGVYNHFLLLSWAGQSLIDCYKQVDKSSVLPAISTAYKEIHRLRILHGDAAPRNLLYDAATRCLMVTDFERSEICPRTFLNPISPNSQRKRKRGPDSKSETDKLEREERSAVRCVEYFFDTGRAF